MWPVHFACLLRLKLNDPQRDEESQIAWTPGRAVVNLSRVTPLTPLTPLSKLNRSFRGEMVMRKLPSALLWASVLAGPAWGDDVLEQIEQAKQYYADKDYAGAITELQFAVDEIRSKVNTLYADTFPAAPAGWTSDAPETEEGAAFFGGGSAISRTYSQDGGAGSIDAQLLVDNPMVQGLAAMLSSPMLMAAQPNMKRVRIQRENASCSGRTRPSPARSVSCSALGFW
jgi:hypothetical protein